MLWQTAAHKSTLFKTSVCAKAIATIWRVIVS